MSVIIPITESDLEHVEGFSVKNCFGCGCGGVVFWGCGDSICDGAGFIE